MYDFARVMVTLNQGLTSLGLQLLASTIVSTVILVAVLFLFFRWLEAGSTKPGIASKVLVCMYCGSRALNVSPVKDAAGRSTAFCYCNNCKRYFSLDIPAG